MAKATTHLVRETFSRVWKKRSSASLYEFVRIGRKEGRMIPNIDTDTQLSL